MAWYRNVYGEALYDAGIARRPGEIFQAADEAQADYFVRVGVCERVEAPRVEEVAPPSRVRRHREEAE